MVRNFYKALALLVVVVLLFACKTSQPTIPVVKDVVKKGNITTPSTSALAYTIQSATVTDSILKLEVEFVQPCGNYSFDLVADGKMAKSLPPQITTFLILNLEKPGTCRNKKKRTEVLLFNINPLRVNGQSKVIINLNENKPVEFNYFPFVSID